MSVRILIGDALTELSNLPDESVHCCVTSPPYYGLRDYGTAQWDGGDARCDHAQKRNMGATTLRLDGREHVGVYDGEKATTVGTPYRGACGKCGARRIDRQIGLEPSPDAYVTALVAVFREVRRVLRRDATLWLNVGDSYASTAPGTMGDSLRQSGIFAGVKDETAKARVKYRPKTPAGIKPKDLIGIPWMLAFALRADGWYLRQDIIWSKPNPMPESVTDRCTKAHEYLFLLSKSERYWFDAAAIAEIAVQSSGGWQTRARNGESTIGKNSFQPIERADGGECSGPGRIGETRNRRSVWTIASEPFAEAHFATFPPALIEPCILAGCPRGGAVLDPFGGAGTTGLVADRLGRNAILIELNPEYAVMAKRRVYQDGPLFAAVAICSEKNT